MLLTLFQNLLRAPEGDGGGGGGPAAGGGAGGQQGNPGGGPGAVNPVTMPEVNDAITKALNARLKTFGDQQTKVLNDAIAAASTTITTGLTESVASLLEEKLRPPGAEPKPPLSEAELSNNPVFKGLKKQLEETNARLQQSEAKTLAESKKARRETMRRTLNEALLKVAVAPEAMEQAIGWLTDSRGAVAYETDDTDQIVFRDRDGSVVDLESGVKSWAASDEGKRYQAPRNANGSGDGPNRSGTPKPHNAANGQVSETELGSALASLHR